MGLAIYPFTLLLGIATALMATMSLAAWWQMLLLAMLWRIIDRHHYHGIGYQTRLAWIFGLGYFTQGLWWLYISLHDIGGMPFWMAVGAVLILSAFLAIFPSLAVYIGARFYQKSYSAIAWASAWTLMEWARAHVLTGFPWIGFADAQVSGPFMGLIPIFGVLGATFAAVWGSYKIGSAPGRLFLPLISLFFAIGISSLLEGIEYTEPVGKRFDVRLLQGNFPMTTVYSEEQLRIQNAFYLETFTQKPADLILAPETAITIPENLLPPNWDQRIKEYLSTNQISLLTGIVGVSGKYYANRALGYQPNGATYVYDKSHLVPFGEYIPPGFEWFVRAIQAPLTQFARGDSNQAHFPLNRAQQATLYGAVMICYEDVFGSEIASRLRSSKNPPNFLINMTNLAWFGNTSAPWQHLRLAQLRSLETGLPTIRATNTGVTAIIDAKGKVQVQLPIFEQDVLTGSVQAMTGSTPYVLLGDRPIITLSFLILALCWWKRRQSKKP